MPSLNVRPVLATWILLVGTAVPSRAAELALKPALLSEDGYSETFSVSSAMPDGWVQIQIVVTNIGPGSGRAVCRLMLSLPGLQWAEQTMISPGDWAYRAPELAVGACQADPTHFVATTRQGDRVEFKLESSHIPARVPTPRAGAPTAELEVALGDRPIPATVTVTPREGPARIYRNPAWLSHDLARQSLRQLGTHWVRFRSTDTLPPIYGILLAHTDTSDATGWMAGDGLAPAQISATGLTADAARGTESFGIRLTDTEIRMRPAASVLAFEPLRDMGLLGRVMGSIVGDPILSVIRVTWDSPSGQRQGVLETTVFR